MNNINQSENKLNALEKSIFGFGKDGYPFRHKDYELNTCVPCADFSNWIIDRLEENDIWAIKLLQWEICRDSGFMVGIPESKKEKKQKPKELDVLFWSSCVNVDNELSKEIPKYLFASNEVEREIQCLFMRSNISKETAFGYFYNPNEYAYNYHFNTLLDALSCHKINFNVYNIYDELEKANSIYKQYVSDYKNEKNAPDMFNKKDLDIDYSLIESNELAITLSKLAIGSRLHFWDLINSSFFTSGIRINRRKSLECWFRTKSFGFDQRNSNSDLINSELVKVLDNKEIILRFLTKKELLTIFQEFGITLKLQTPKSTILKTLGEIRNSDNYILDYARLKELYRFDNLMENDLAKLIEYKNQLSKVLLLLCTIDFGCEFRKSTFVNDQGKFFIIYEDDPDNWLPLNYG